MLIYEYMPYRTNMTRSAVMSQFGTSRHFAAAQQFGRFVSEANIEPP